MRRWRRLGQYDTAGTGGHVVWQGEHHFPVRGDGTDVAFIDCMPSTRFKRRITADRSNVYAVAAACILLAGVAYEIFRLFVPWPRVDYGLSATISSLLITVWTVGAVTVLTRRKLTASASLGWVLTFGAPVLMGIHGVATRTITQSWLGLVYIPMAVLLGFCLKRVWDRREYWALRRRALRRKGVAADPRAAPEPG